MDGEEAIYYLEYLRRDVHAKSLYDVALVKAIDALKQGSEPVKHAKWYAPASGEPCEWCSNCHERTRWFFDEGYCPNCGARMDGDTNEEP